MLAPSLFLVASLALISSEAAARERKPSAFGLVHDDAQYHNYCDVGDVVKASEDSRTRACFATDVDVAKYLSKPQPANLTGFIDESGKSKSSRPSLRTRSGLQKKLMKV